MLRSEFFLEMYQNCERSKNISEGAHQLPEIGHSVCRQLFGLKPSLHTAETLGPQLTQFHSVLQRSATPNCTRSICALARATVHATDMCYLRAASTGSDLLINYSQNATWHLASPWARGNSSEGIAQTLAHVSYGLNMCGSYVFYGLSVSSKPSIKTVSVEANMRMLLFFGGKRPEQSKGRRVDLFLGCLCKIIKVEDSTVCVTEILNGMGKDMSIQQLLESFSEIKRDFKGLKLQLFIKHYVNQCF